MLKPTHSHPRKLSPQLIENMITRRSQGATYQMLSHEFDVSTAYVGRIFAGMVWSWATGFTPREPYGLLAGRVRAARGARALRMRIKQDKIAARIAKLQTQLEMLSRPRASAVTDLRSFDLV